MAEPAPFHDRDGLIWLDGKLVPWRRPTSTCSRTPCTTAAPSSRASAPTAARSSSSRSIPSACIDSARALDFEIPYTVAEIDQVCRDVVKANNLSDCYVRPIAWRGSEQIGVSAQATKIHLAVAAWEWGSYFPMEQRLKGIRLDDGEVPPPRPDDGAGEEQGRGPLHDLHHREASRRARGLCRCADARLARARRGVHGRQHLLRQGRRHPHARSRLLPRRHHAAHGDRARQEARLRDRRARDHARRAWLVLGGASSPAPPPR